MKTLNSKHETLNKLETINSKNQNIVSKFEISDLGFV
jgi:hypothetical protein